MNYIKVIFCLSLSVTMVTSMALHGKPLTRYQPCSLGNLLFDKISDKFWQGVVNLALYSNFTSKVEFSIYFDKQVKIYGVSLCFHYYFFIFSFMENQFDEVRSPAGSVINWNGRNCTT